MQTPLKEFAKQTKRSNIAKKESLKFFKKQNQRKPPQIDINIQPQEEDKDQAEAKVMKQRSAIKKFLSNSITSVKRESFEINREI
jgi:hypothetical protein